MQKVFEENENSYPVKPDLAQDRRGQHWIAVFLMVFTVLVFTSDLVTSFYIVLLELLLVLVIHELGHYIIMRIYGAKAQGMFFLALIGVRSKNLKNSDSLKQQTFINLMGPVPGLIIGSLLFIYVMFNEPNIYLIELSLLFFGINLINLIPIDPFDGGRIVAGFFFSKNDQLKMGFTLVSSLTILIAGVFLNFWPLIIFGFLMGLKVRSFQKSSALHEDLSDTNIDYKKDYKELTNREYWMIRKAFISQNPKLKEMIPSGFTLWENEKLLVEQVRQLLRINVKPDLSNNAKIGVILFMIIIGSIPLYLISSHYGLIEWYIENSNV